MSYRKNFKGNALEMMRALISLFLSMTLVACVETATPTAVSPGTSPATGSPLQVSRGADFASIPMRSFQGGSKGRGVRRSNNDIALEFLDLAFSLETGERLSRLTKFDGQITVSFNQQPTATGRRDLNQLVSRLKNEAGIDIRVVPVGSPSAIKIEQVQPRLLRSIAPGAACFVVPNIIDTTDLRKNGNLPRSDWARIARRTKAAIFLPIGVSAQEQRDCLHEELAQALGPLNDLYRVGDTIFNDDNFHVTLTPYDMLILRLYYSPELRNGMTRTEVALAIRPLLARLNPAGQGAPGRASNKTERSWSQLIEEALGPTTSSGRREGIMTQAINSAKNLRYNGNRLAFAHYARARITSRTNPPGSASDFQTSFAIYQTLYGLNDIHSAKLSVDLAANAFASGDLPTAERLLKEAIPAAQRAEDAVTLTRLYALQAELLGYKGRSNEADRARRNAIGWGKYAFASDRQIADILRTSASLRPPGSS